MGLACLVCTTTRLHVVGSGGESVPETAWQNEPIITLKECYSGSKLRSLSRRQLMASAPCSVQALFGSQFRWHCSCRCPTRRFIKPTQCNEARSRFPALVQTTSMSHIQSAALPRTSRVFFSGIRRPADDAADAFGATTATRWVIMLEELSTPPPPPAAPRQLLEIASW